jgi:hypothetical protein
MTAARRRALASLTIVMRSALRVCLLLTAALLFCRVTACADEPGQAAERALQDAANFPWLDAETGQLQEIVLPGSGKPPHIKNWEWPDLVPDWKWNKDWNFSIGDLFGTIFEICAWVLLIGLVVAIIIMLIRTYLESEGFGGPTRGQANDSDNRRSDAERIENLPFDVKVARTDLLSEASRLRQAGSYGKALVYLFSYQLIQLDKKQFIRLTKGKTNRQYLREIRSHHELKRIVGNTMVAFEDYFFGDHPIDRIRFDALWNQIEHFERLVDSPLQENVGLRVGAVH